MKASLNAPRMNRLNIKLQKKKNTIVPTVTIEQLDNPGKHFCSFRPEE
jgi:hypothetical protein